MPWLYLFAAGLCEIVWPLGFKATHGFTNWGRNWPIIFGCFATMLGSFGLMTLACRSLPVGTVYAVWTGMGAVGIAIMGIILYKEPRDAIRLICLGLIIAGIVGLKLFSPPGSVGSQ
jgi:quaternary ammonium compound-resistance protein SugE